MLKDKFLNRGTIAGFSIILAVFALFSYFIINLDWEFADWTQVYYPAARSFLNPYFEVTPERELYFYNPPWLAWILLPITVFPERVALALWMVLTILLTVWCVKKLDGGIFEVLLVLCSPAFVRLFIHAQIDIVVLLGFTILVTSTQIYTQGFGLLLMAIKPQVLSLGVLIHWLNLNRNDKVRILLPITAVTLISFLIYGFWPAELYDIRNLISRDPNVSIWPYGIPIGVILLGIAIKRKNVYWGALATFFFTPYLISHSLFAYTAVLFTRLPKKWSALIFAILWVLALMAT